MRAIGFNRNGGPEVLEFVERDSPEPGPGEVLVDVAYAGVNFAEVQHRRGEFGSPDGPGGYGVPGLEAAGSVAAGIARSLGAGRVIGTVGSAAKLELAERLGYDELFLREGFEDAAGPVDVVLDPVGGAVRRRSLGLLNPFGRVVVYGDLARSEDWAADVFDLWKNNRSVTGFNIGDLARRAPATIGDHLGRALAALASGDLRAEPPTVRAWTEVVGVHREFEAGTTQGKTVLRIGS